ncbi:LysR family transcriptional regulator substrate-binding protein [Blastococcus brunescens]|uniref:LysR family transcriptional regulator substrate-binding protein n=1 Tax=Blastococcus brunescens TaxID=1564165 RepID=A0ABZ1AXG2_9ACTN|nr:LysR family transcriptional regulator substrate-binding protein [Blastococcus sp. BMG 8361]WRL61819.1 LysR family transcriptional regulator substrate-binding protein [Blastococcus sp. BMG 8361]
MILAEVDRAREDVRSAEPLAREQVPLRICTMADRVLDGPLRTVGLAIPGVEVFVTSSPGDDAVEAVRQARADAAVVWSRSQEHRDLDGVVLGSVPFGVVLPEAHPLADRAEVPVTALGSESVVMFPWSPFSGIWQRTVEHLLPGGAQHRQVVVEPDLINSPEAMLRAVAAGSGVAPGILGVAERMDVAGIVVRPLDPPCSSTWRSSGGDRPAPPSAASSTSSSSRSTIRRSSSRLPVVPRRRGRSGLQDHLLAAVGLVLEDAVAVRGLGQGQPVGDHPGRVDLTPLDPVQQRVHVPLHVALAGAQGE